MISKTKINFLNRNKLFNYGLHVNNKLTFVHTKDRYYIRPQNPTILLQDPMLWLERGYLFVKLLKRILKNNDKIAIINTDPSWIGYAEFFEGTNTICYEEPWAPGTLTNPATDLIKPTLLVLVSAAPTDLKLVLTETETTGLPVINLSVHPVSRSFFEHLAAPNRTFVHFYLQLLYCLVWNQQKKDITSNLATLLDTDNQNYILILKSFFQKRKVQINKDKLSEFHSLPKWIQKKTEKKI